MSLNSNNKLSQIAKIVARELRRKSTDAEKKLWKFVRNRNLDNKKFYRQYPVFYDLNGKESFFIADFFCFEESLIVELDGEIHNFRLKEDSERSQILKMLGLKVIRFKNDQVENDIESVLSEIRKYFIKN